MFALGLVAGAIGSYAARQRSHIKRFAVRTLSVRDEVPDEFGGVELVKPKSYRSNHRRKAAAEVT